MINIQGPNNAIQELIDGGELTREGRVFYTDLQDFLYFAAPVGEVVVASGLEDVAEYVSRQQEGRTGIYVTGGFEAWHHVQVIWNLKHKYPDAYFILGLENPSYIEGKGKRPPVFNKTEDKISLWQALLPDGVVFTIPENADYDQIAQVCGVFQHPSIIHLANWDDPKKVLEARQKRAVEGMLLVLEPKDGFNIHTSDLFQTI